MINMQISFFVDVIRTSLSKNLIFHVISLNKDISVTIQLGTLDITKKSSMTSPHIHSEGSMLRFFI